MVVRAPGRRSRYLEFDQAVLERVAHELGARVAVQLALDVRAGDVWALGVQADALWGGRRDLTQRVLIVES